MCVLLEGEKRDCLGKGESELSWGLGGGSEQPCPSGECQGEEHSTRHRALLGWQEQL